MWVRAVAGRFRGNARLPFGCQVTVLTRSVVRERHGLALEVAVQVITCTATMS